MALNKQMINTEMKNAVLVVSILSWMGVQKLLSALNLQHSEEIIIIFRVQVN